MTLLQAGDIPRSKRDTPIYRSNPSVDLFCETVGRVDNEPFVKLFADGVEQYQKLTAAGRLVLAATMEAMIRCQKKNCDTVAMNYIVARGWRKDLIRRNYDRGLHDLLEKEFLYRSVLTDIYFVNVNYLCKGDRLAFLKTHHRQEAAE